MNSERLIIDFAKQFFCDDKNQSGGFHLSIFRFIVQLGSISIHEHVLHQLANCLQLIKCFSLFPKGVILFYTITCNMFPEREGFLK